MESSTIALIIVGIMLILYITELLPLATTSILACLSLAIFGVIPFGAAFSGFSHDVVFLVVGIFIVGETLFETGLAGLIGEKIISRAGTNEKLFITALITVCVIIGMFLVPTATGAIMLPVAASAIAASGGKLTKKNTYMIIGFASVADGGLTVIGNTPQLIAQGILLEGGHETMRFFELSYAGIPKALLLLGYYLTIGYALQKKVFTFPEVQDKDVKELSPGNSVDERPPSAVKMCIAGGTLIFCVIGFLTDLWTLGTVAMAGALVCVVTGCITQQKVFQKMSWSTTVVIVGCSFGLAAGIDQSGAGKLDRAGFDKPDRRSHVPVAFMFCAGPFGGYSGKPHVAYRHGFVSCPAVGYIGPGAWLQREKRGNGRGDCRQRHLYDPDIHPRRSL